MREYEARCGQLQLVFERINLNDEQRELVKRVTAEIFRFDLIEANVSEKIQIAEAVQKAVDWIRFRAGLDKECFECRWKNPPEACACIKCEQIFICEACSVRSSGQKLQIWRCEHAVGFKAREAIKMAYRPRSEAEPDKEPSDRAPREPRRAPPKLFSFGGDDQAE